MLNATQLSFEYQYESVFQNINFSLQSGEILHLCGNNGSGKTTLLKTLTGLMTPLEGDVLWRDVSIFKQLCTYHQQISFVGHKMGLNPILSAKENCQFEGRSLFNETLFKEIAIEFGLQPLIDKPCGQISQGQQRRAALMRLILKPASIWFLDEPFTALDKPSQTYFMTRIVKHLEHGGMAVVTSHQPLPEHALAIRELHL